MVSVAVAYLLTGIHPGIACFISFVLGGMAFAVSVAYDRGARLLGLTLVDDVEARKKRSAELQNPPTDSVERLCAWAGVDFATKREAAEGLLEPLKGLERSSDRWGGPAAVLVFAGILYLVLLEIVAR